MILDCAIDSKGKLIDDKVRSLRSRIHKFFNDILKHTLRDDQFLMGQDEWEDIKKYVK